ncbi:MAG: hypothetical protein F4233_09840 [Rhodospirillaceae bacterium]|nr:hypothetical protein [Rhodospirillaceae bacterium]
MIADVIATTNTATGLAIARPVRRLRITLRVSASATASIIVHNAMHGAVIGRRSRGRVGAAVADDAAVTALDTSSLLRVADDAHSSAVMAPMNCCRRRRLPHRIFSRFMAYDPPWRALVSHRTQQAARPASTYP